MEEVCKEVRRPLTWYYDSDHDLYIRKDKFGNKNGLIHGMHLPDPMKIQYGRLRAIEKGQLPKGARIHADPVTCQLWEHWHAKFNH